MKEDIFLVDSSDKTKRIKLTLYARVLGKMTSWFTTSKVHKIDR
jgi:hypothetical protein